MDLRAEPVLIEPSTTLVTAPPVAQWMEQRFPKSPLSDLAWLSAARLCCRKAGALHGQALRPHYHDLVHDLGRVEREVLLDQVVAAARSGSFVISPSVVSAEPRKTPMIAIACDGGGSPERERPPRMRSSRARERACQVVRAARPRLPPDGRRVKRPTAGRLASGARGTGSHDAHRDGVGHTRQCGRAAGRPRRDRRGGDRPRSLPRGHLPGRSRAGVCVDPVEERGWEAHNSRRRHLHSSSRGRVGARRGRTGGRRHAW